MAGRFRLLGVWLALAVLAGSGVGAQPTIDPKDDPVIPLVEFDSATVGAVLDLLFTEAQYSATPDVLALPVGRLRLVNKRVSEILNFVAQQAGLQWRYENGVFLITRRLPEEPKTAEQPPSDKGKESAKSQQTEHALPTTPRVVSPTEFQERLQSASQPILTEYLRVRNLPVADACFLLGIPFQGISTYQTIHDTVAAQYRQLYSSFNAIPPMWALPNDVRNKLRDTLTSAPVSMPMAPSAPVGVDPFARPPSLSGEVAQQFAPGFPGPGGFGQPGAGGPFGGGLGAGGAGGILSFITGLQQIYGIPTQNAILVRGTSEAIEELRRILALIDVAPDQVEIESQFVSITTTAQNVLGIDWSVAGTEITAVTSGMSSPGTINIGLVRGNLSATLGALLASNRGRVIQAPRAFTINGLPAIFLSSVTRPFFVQVVIPVSVGGTLQPITVTTPAAAQISIALIAIPFINEDQTVTVFIQPIVQDIVGEVTSPIAGAPPVPIVASTFTVSLVRVRSGESFAIGGLLTTRTSQQTQEIPLLARLPLIGSLFRRRARITDETNLIIFVTPRIVPAEELASS